MCVHMSSIHRHTCVYMYIYVHMSIIHFIHRHNRHNMSIIHRSTSMYQILDFLFLLLDRVFLSIPRCPTTGSVGFKLRVISSLSL